jgi:hypothetical protein
MRRRSFAFLLVALVLPGVASAATISIVNADGPGEGFNDPTVATEPAPGNPGTTIGAQRLFAFQYAANIWGALLESDVEILVRSQFNPLSCTATSAVLGSAGARTVSRDFLGAEIPTTWYHAALANRLSGEDQVPPGDPFLPHEDINAQFNSNLGQPTCLAASGWYYGLNANQPANRINLVTVLLHEFAHGLGFSGFTSVTSGAQLAGSDDIYGQYAFDVTAGLSWNDMTQNSQRQASAINSRKVVWKGLHSNIGAPDVLALGTPFLRINAPDAIAATYDFGAAAFGAPLTAGGLTGDVVQALDVAEPAGGGLPAGTTTDGCSALSNAGDVSGKIALVDRGRCGFIEKVKNCQNAGAIGVIVADNVAGAPPAGLGGVDPTIVIPSGRVTLAVGNSIKAELGNGANATLYQDETLRAGTERTTGLLHLNAPNPVQPGSSISHWDPIAFKNLLMEPSINADLTHGLAPPADLTLNQMVDIGWFSDGDGVPDGIDLCIGSDPSATVQIDGCDSGVPNHNSILGQAGCKISDFVEECAANATDHDDFTDCVSEVTQQLKKQGLISGPEKGQIQACAGLADIP